MGMILCLFAIVGFYWLIKALGDSSSEKKPIEMPNEDYVIFGCSPISCENCTPYCYYDDNREIQMSDRYVYCGYLQEKLPKGYRDCPLAKAYPEHLKKVDYLVN